MTLSSRMIWANGIHDGTRTDPGRSTKLCRNIPTNNANTPELEGKRFRQPAAFAAGAQDVALMIDPNWREGFEASFDDLRFLEIIEGAGHWVQMEKPTETNAAILRFLESLRS